MDASTTNKALWALSQVFRAPGYQSTAEWANCKGFAESFALYNEYITAIPTSACTAPLASDEYARDPCCNIEYESFLSRR